MEENANTPTDKAGITAHGPTRWAGAIAAAGSVMSGASGNEDLSVVRCCWPAMYAFCLQKGCSPTQAFAASATWAEQLLDGSSLHSDEEPPGGRQRELLEESAPAHLQRCVHNGWDLVSPRIDAAHGRVSQIMPLITSLSADQEPNDAFRRTWGASLVVSAIRRARDVCRADRLGPHWGVFHARVLRPAWLGHPPEPYRLLLGQWNIPDSAQASVMLTQVQRLVVSELRDLVETTLISEVQVDMEIHVLRDALSGDDMAAAARSVLEWAVQGKSDQGMVGADLIARDLGAASAVDLFCGSHDVGTLRAAKDCFKTLRLVGEAAADRRLGGHLYVASIAAARQHHDEVISRQSSGALERGLEGVMEETQLPAEIRSLAREEHARL